MAEAMNDDDIKINTTCIFTDEIMNHHKILIRLYLTYKHMSN